MTLISEKRFIISRLALIPARGGSKGIPLKNLERVGNLSLLIRAFSVARDSGLFDEICISSDSPAIIEEAERFGAEIHFVRPEKLSLDTTLQSEVIQHALSFFSDRGRDFENLTLLQPTSPFRQTLDLVSAHELFESSGANTLISVLDVTRLDDSSIYFNGLSSEREILNLIPKSINSSQKLGTLRQDFKSQYWRNGSIYIFKLIDMRIGNELLKAPIVGYIMDNLKSINIDSAEDLELARIVEPFLREILESQ